MILMIQKDKLEKWNNPRHKIAHGNEFKGQTKTKNLETIQVLKKIIELY